MGSIGRLPPRSAAWPARSGHSALAYNGKLWVMAGANGGGYNNDVWNSPNGSNWNQVTPVTVFGSRSGQEAVNFAGKMWVIGGVGPGGCCNGGYYKDVWYSTDGATWSAATTAAGFGPRAHFGCAVFMGKMWVIGGMDGISQRNDVWNSFDGITWTPINNSCPWAIRDSLQVAVYNNMLWVLGGQNGNGTNEYDDAWYSPDGSTWTSATTTAQYPARDTHSALTFNNQLWVLAGEKDPGGPVLGDVWYSPLGGTVTPVPTCPPTNTPTVTSTATPTATDTCVQLDLSFNSTGMDQPSFGLNAYPGRLTLDPAGKILQVGSGDDGTYNYGLLARYNADGTIDSTFGTSAVNFDFNDVKVDSGGGILVAGSDASSRLAVWRLLNNGNVDSSFGTSGEFSVGSLAGGTMDQANALAIDQLGRIVLTGQSKNAAGHYEMVVMRLSSLGVPDATFGPGGARLFTNTAGGNGDDVGNAVKIDSLGNILVTGSSVAATGKTDMVLWRISSTGTLDSSLNGSGFVLKANTAGANYSDSGNSLVLDVSGNILVVGSSTNNTTLSQMVVWRFTSGGLIDPGFGGGTGYILYTDPQYPGWGAGSDISLDMNGRILASGVCASGPNAYNNIIIRLLSTGTLDPAFAGGQARQPQSGSYLPEYVLTYLGQDTSNRILLSGGINESQYGGNMAAWRYVDICSTFNTPTPSPTVTPTPTSTATYAPFQSSLFYLYDATSITPGAPTKLMGNSFGVAYNTLSATASSVGSFLIGSWVSDPLNNPTIPPGNWDFALVGYESGTASGCAYFHMKVYDYSAAGPTTTLLFESVAPTALSSAPNSTTFWTAAEPTFTLPLRDKLYTEIYVDKSCATSSTCILQYGGSPAYSRFDAPGVGTGANDKFGNRSVIGSPVTFTMNASVNKTSMRFTANSAGTLSAVQFYMLSVTGSPGYKVSIQGDSAGVPNGVLAPATNFTPAAGWNNVTLGTSVAVTAGGTYHVVVEWDGLSILGTNTASLLQGTAPDTGYLPLNQTFSGALGVAQNTGSGWQATSIMPVFLVDVSGTWVGNPLAESGGSGILGNSYLAQRFRVVSSPLTIASVSAFVSQVGATVPLDNLYWEIRNSGTNVVVPGGSGTLITAQTMSSPGWVGNLIPTLILAPGNYRLVLKSPLSTATSYYYWPAQDPVSTVAPYISNTYDGVTSYSESSGDGGNTFNPMSASLNNDFGFDFLPGTSSVPTFTPTGTPSGTPTNTVNATSTNSPTNTKTPTPTNTATLTATNSTTNSATGTPTNSATQTPTNSATNSATQTATNTPTNSTTNTATSTATATNTVTNSSTNTATNSATNTATQTATNTATNSATNTATNSRTNTATNTVTNTATTTATNTATATNTVTNTTTNTGTSTATLTASSTATSTSTNTVTNTVTNSATNTATRTATSTATNTLTNTATNTATPTSTFTNSATASATYTPTNSATQTSTNSPTNTVTTTYTPTNSATLTATLTATNSATPTNSRTASMTNTPTATATNSSTPTNSPTRTSTFTPTLTSTFTDTLTATFTATITFTPTITYSPTTTSSPTQSPTPNAALYLDSNFFNPNLTALGMDVRVDNAGEVKIDVFNLVGEEVEKLVDQTLSPGNYRFSWDGRNSGGAVVGNAVYFIVIQQPSGKLVRKVIVLR